MKTTKRTLTEQIRDAVEASGLTRYAISKATGIDQAVLCRFITHGRSVRSETLDALTDFLGLHLEHDREGGR